MNSNRKSILSSHFDDAASINVEGEFGLDQRDDHLKEQSMEE